MEIYCNSLRETELLAKKIASNLKPNDIIAFEGDLGAGKTTFTSFLVKHFGCDSFVTSPTFSLVNHYKCSPDIFHFDMYRIKSLDDLYSTGFFDYIDNGNILLIEWSENIKDFLPNNIININIKNINETSRKFIINDKTNNRS